jgi:hypothetical protein
MSQFTYSLLMVLEQVNISQINAFNSRLHFYNKYPSQLYLLKIKNYS